ncbi:hypothetical protein C9374_008620 [Naegleria lovaniensis]|uniref:Uncharacterized protein n=1 Tax=Naegleria lovaniensis TaxID=51637 RepID=A0AA88KHM9_NAELO|nr:uncharacterized protein C9374_008620 [Naegleria lovaniensis]KAG2377998.1 hypothetical protein C9374_008620 [Naegleria lovaniensis]
MSRSKIGITDEDFYGEEDEHSEDEIMLVQDDDQALASNAMMNEESEEESPLDERLDLFKKPEYRDDDSTMQDDHGFIFSKAMMHDYIGHTIQQICVLFHNNKIPAITSNIYSRKQSNFTELILAISVRNTVRFYSLIHNRDQMNVKEISDENNHTKTLVLESNVKFMKSFDNTLIVCDEKGIIHVLKFQVNSLQQEKEDSLFWPEHELEIFRPFNPFQCLQANSECNYELLSFDSEVLSEGEAITLSLAMGTSNGQLLYVTLSSKSGSQFEVLKQQKYQHKSMLPILGVTFAIKNMITVEIPTLIYYRTLNCVFSIDMNNLDSQKDSTLIIRAKEIITYLSVHPLQPNHIILGLSNGFLVGKDPNTTWEKTVSNTAIKVIQFDEQQKGVVVGDEQGYVYRIEDLATARHDQTSKRSEASTSIGTVLDNIDGHDISYIQALSENEWFVVSPNGRINLVMN